MRHVGGSLLPSNEQRILQPVEAPFGTLQVRVISEIDAHGLFLTHRRGESLLATHPNGYSCHVLLTAMRGGDREKVAAQAQHIWDCGGTTKSVDHILSAMTVHPVLAPPPY